MSVEAPPNKNHSNFGLVLLKESYNYSNKSADQSEENSSLAQQEVLEMTPELIEGSVSNIPQRNQFVEHELLTPIRTLLIDDK